MVVLGEHADERLVRRGDRPRCMRTTTIFYKVREVEPGTGCGSSCCSVRKSGAAGLAIY